MAIAIGMFPIMAQPRAIACADVPRPINALTLVATICKTSTSNGEHASKINNEVVVLMFELLSAFSSGHTK